MIKITTLVTIAIIMVIVFWTSFFMVKMSPFHPVNNKLIGRDIKPIMYDEGIDIIAKTLWAEARGESYAGKLAVASVIYNRSKKKHIPLIDVCLAKKQFSCWNKGYVKVTKGKAWKDCREIAEQMINGSFRPIGPWDHYYAHKRCKPYWAKDLTNVTIIGNQTFGNCN